MSLYEIFKTPTKEQQFDKSIQRVAAQRDPVSLLSVKCTPQQVQDPPNEPEASEYDAAEEDADKAEVKYKIPFVAYHKIAHLWLIDSGCEKG